MREICLKLTIKTPERRHWRRSCVFIVNFDYISNIVLMFYCSDLTVHTEHVNVSMEVP